MTDARRLFADGVDLARSTTESQAGKEAVPVVASDRRRPSDFDLDNYQGKHGEVVAHLVRTDILGGTAEVKHDLQAIHTGNLYIEERCFLHGSWLPSGPKATRAMTCAYVMGDRLICVWMPTWLWVEVVERVGAPRECNNSANPTRGHVVGLNRLLLEALAVVKGSRR